MECLTSGFRNGFIKFSPLSSQRLTKYRFHLPISKFRFNRASILRVSASFGERSRRRNSLRKKFITSNPDLGEGLRDKVTKDSVLLNELESWVNRYNKEVEYWGIGYNPIFTVYKGINGNVERVEVNEEEVLRRGSDKVKYAKELAKRMENGEESLVHKDSSLVKFVSSCSDINGNVERVEFNEEEDSNKIKYAKELAEQMENVVHKDSSLVKFKVKEELSLVSEVKKGIVRFDLGMKLPVIGRGVLCCYLGLWLLKTVFVYRKKSGSGEVESREVEKEMMRRKMKAWKEKEVVEKGSVEVLQEDGLEKPLVSLQKPKFDRKKLMSRVNGSEKTVELLDSSRRESGECMEFDDKIVEIKAMARRAREIEASIELNEKEKHDVNKETEDDESVGILTESDQENTELSGLATPMVNGLMVDSCFPNGKMAASDAKTIDGKDNQVKTEPSGLAIPMVNGDMVDSSFLTVEVVNNAVPLVPTNGAIQSSDDSKDTLSTEKNITGRKSRVIRSVKEAKEFLSRKSTEKELTQTIAQDSDEIFPKQIKKERSVAKKHKSSDKNKILGASVNGTFKSAPESNSFEPSEKDVVNEREERETSLFESAENSSGGTKDIVKEQPSGKESWIEKHYDEFKPITNKMRAGFRDNYMAARKKETKEPGTIAEIQEIYRNEDNDELEWMKDEKLRDIVFHVRDNELTGKDPFHLIDAEDKAMFLQGLEKKVEKENEKLSHLHQWIHSNIENLDYGVDGISVYDPPEKVIPRWKGQPPLEKNPEFLDNYEKQREALFTDKAASVSPMEKEDQSSLQEASQSENTVTSRKPKIVVEGSDGSVKPGKKSGKEYWQHTKKWSQGFLELYNAETDPEVKAAMRDMGKDLDRWITEDEIKDAADIMEKLPEKNKKFMEKKLNKLKREMELFGPQAVLSKYREYGEVKEEDYLWWLDLPHVLCLEMYTADDKGEQQVGFYTLEMATDLELEPKPHHVIAFEEAADCRNLCYIIQAHLDMLRTGNVFIVPRPPKDAFREAKANGFGVTVIKKGELKLNIDDPLEEVEERICEIGSKMYHDKIMEERGVDISSLMKGVFNLKTKPTSKRRKQSSKQALKNPYKKST